MTGNDRVEAVAESGFHDLEYFALKVKQALPGRYCSN